MLAANSVFHYMIVSIWANSFASPDLSVSGSFVIIFKSSSWIDQSITSGFTFPANGGDPIALSEPAGAL